MNFPSKFLFLALLIGLSIVGCSSLNTAGEEPEEFERRELPRQLTEQEAEFVDGSGHFGFNLMHRLVEAEPEKSHFVSPLSIQAAYGMTMNGAEGKTYTQIKETLGLDGMTGEEINEAARELLELLTRLDDNNARFTIANSIWYRNTFSVKQDFLTMNRDYYEAEIEAADFGDPKTVDRINDWVDDKTEGLISEIVEGPMDQLTVMYLINAIYFSGDWTMPFDADKTRKKPFQRPDGSKIQAETMRMEQQEQMLYQRGGDYEAVNLYYGDAGFAMTLVLPDKDVGIETWIKDLDWNKWQKLTGQFNQVTLSMDLPKFEMEYEIDHFKKILMDMGITDAFDPSESDFSRMNPGRDDLHISDTRHKSFIRVDEKGTEAAAVTSNEMRLVSAPQLVNINFNRPFFYVIREVESGAILFMGTMTDPSSSSS